MLRWIYWSVSVIVLFTSTFTYYNYKSIFYDRKINFIKFYNFLYLTSVFWLTRLMSIVPCHSLVIYELFETVYCLVPLLCLCTIWVRNCSVVTSSSFLLLMCLYFASYSLLGCLGVSSSVMKNDAFHLLWYVTRTYTPLLPFLTVIYCVIPKITHPKPLPGGPDVSTDGE